MKLKIIIIIISIFILCRNVFAGFLDFNFLTWNWGFNTENIISEPKYLISGSGYYLLSNGTKYIVHQ
jgi:hypothetical protein